MASSPASAASGAASPSSSSSSSSPPSILSRPAPRNPTPLSAPQEAAVRALYHKRVRAYCADEIREFAHCAAGRTFSATWACRIPRRAMNACMISHATQDEEDAARREWFGKADERVRERVEAAEKKQKYDEFTQKWWGEYRDEKGTGTGSSSGGGGGGDAGAGGGRRGGEKS